MSWLQSSARPTEVASDAEADAACLRRSPARPCPSHPFHCSQQLIAMPRNYCHGCANTCLQQANVSLPAPMQRCKLSGLGHRPFVSPTNGDEMLLCMEKPSARDSEERLITVSHGGRAAAVDVLASWLPSQLSLPGSIRGCGTVCKQNKGADVALAPVRRRV